MSVARWISCGCKNSVVNQEGARGNPRSGSRLYWPRPVVSVLSGMKAKFMYAEIRVKDIEESFRFYTQVLGMKESGRGTFDPVGGTFVNLVMRINIERHILQGELNQYLQWTPRTFIENFFLQLTFGKPVTVCSRKEECGAVPAGWELFLF